MTSTIRQALRNTIARLNQAQTDSPGFTARALLAQVMDKPREWLVAHDDEPLDSSAAVRLESLIARVAAHEPLAYILGHREFYGIELLVDSRVLIPRPETEMLVELALAHLGAKTSDNTAPLHPILRHAQDVYGKNKDDHGEPVEPHGDVQHVEPQGVVLQQAQDDHGERVEPWDVIDVGTGSGAVAIAIAIHAPQARIMATDVSNAALDVARENARRNGVSERIQFVQGDLLANLGDGMRASVITANLPYVTIEEIDSLPPEIQSHEPRVALDGGADGLALVRRLLAQVDAHLCPGGLAVFEIGAAQGSAALCAAREALPGWRVELRQDLAKLDRMLYVAKPRIELLAFDLDGTVLDDTFQISARVERAVRDAITGGVRVTIATGLPVAVTRPFATALGVNAPVIAMQGGLIYDFASETTLHELTLPHELGCALAELEPSHPAWQAVLYLGDEMYISSIRYPRDFYAALLGANLVVHSDLCAALGQRAPDKVLYIVPPEDAPEALSALRQLAGDQATVVQSHALFVEVNPRDAYKGAGLARLAADLNIPRECVMAIGDQDNDASMIEWAGVGVAMGNASPASKAVADWIAPPIGEDGAALAIEKFILA